MVILASGQWYTSGTFWTVIGVAIGTAAIVVSVLLWRFGMPRAVLEYSVPVSKSLISDDLPMGRIQVTLDGKQVARPHIVTLRLVNRGRRDIRSSDFDQDKAIVLNLGAEIIDILNLADLTSVRAENQQVMYGPTLIRRDQKVTIDLLVDGEPGLQVTDSLADVKVRSPQPDPIWVLVVLVAYLCLSGIGLIGIGVFSSSQGIPSGTVLGWVSGLLFLAAAVVLPLSPIGRRLRANR